MSESHDDSSHDSYNRHELKYCVWSTNAMHLLTLRIHLRYSSHCRFVYFEYLTTSLNSASLSQMIKALTSHHCRLGAVVAKVLPDRHAVPALTLTPCLVAYMLIQLANNNMRRARPWNCQLETTTFGDLRAAPRVSRTQGSKKYTPTTISTHKSQATGVCYNSNRFTQSDVTVSPGYLSSNH